MLTRSGRAMLVFSLVVGIAGVALGYPVLLVLALAGVVAVVVGLGYLALRPLLEVHREVQPERVTVGEVALGLVDVTNRSGRPLPPLIAADRIGALDVDVVVPRIEAHGHRRATYRLPTAHRAIVEVGPLRLARTDPLGMIQFAQQHGDIKVLYVHPRRHLLRPLPASPARSIEGPTSDTAPRGTITFHAIREYVLGDDLRHIHWRSTAHTGELMVREFIDTSLPDLTVVLDLRPDHLDADEFEQAVEIVASVVLASTVQQFPVRLVTTDGAVLDSRGGHESGTAFLDRLAGLSQSDAGDFVLVHNLLVKERRGYALTVVTGAADESDIRALTRVRQQFGQALIVDARATASSAPTTPGATSLHAATSEAFATYWNAGVFR